MISSNDEMEKYRRELADIDWEILKQVSTRNEIAKKIGDIKAQNAKQVVVPSVEDIVVSRYIKNGKELDVSEYTARRIARAVIDESVDVQGRIPRTSESKKICIIGGNGGMGRWLAAFFSKRSHIVSVVDTNTDGCEYPIVNIEEGVKSDIIIISTPVPVAEKILEKVFSLGPKGIVFDILSVKNPIITTLKKAVNNGFQVCSVHPMYGPRAASIAGRNVLILDVGCIKANETAAEIFAGGSIFTLPLEEHDSLAAYLLGLSHAVNLAYSDVLAKSDFTFKDLSLMASTTFAKQSAVSREVSEENAELYYVIQRQNPKNKEVLEKLLESVKRVMTMSREDFIESMNQETIWYSSKK